MEENFVWMTTRRIKPGTLADFKRTWRPERHPDGMLHAYPYWSDDEQEIVAVSSWVAEDHQGHVVQFAGRAGQQGRRPVPAAPAAGQARPLRRRR
jgi:hypothetical protein